MKDILLTVSVLLVLWYIPFVLYVRFGLFRWLYHGVLKWHQPDKTKKWEGGYFIRSTCKFCGKDITRDNQGNWWSDDEW